MLLRKSPSLEATIRSSEITPSSVFEQPHPLPAAASSPPPPPSAPPPSPPAPSPRSSIPPTTVQAAEQLKTIPSKYTLPDPQTPLAKASTYNNFYEFGTDKSDPSHEAHRLPTRPWPIQITGMVKKPQTINIDDLIHYRPLESRVYRFRCVEAWSMIIPWDGYSLSEFINFCQPLPSAKYVQFFSFNDKKVMPDEPSGYDWPYREGLRMDEAMNPLTLLTFGCYGQVLPNQNGAPVRVIVPWKYGFKSAKVHRPLPLHRQGARDHLEPGRRPRIRLLLQRQSQLRQRPLVPGPRAPLDSSTFPRNIPTLMFNGYGDQVASLYAGMDLKKFY